MVTAFAILAMFIECNPLELSLINKSMCAIRGKTRHQKKAKNITIHYRIQREKTSPVLGSPSATGGCIASIVPTILLRQTPFFVAQSLLRL